MNDNELWQLFEIGISVLFLFWVIWAAWALWRVTRFLARKIDSFFPKTLPKPRYHQPQHQSRLTWQEKVARGEWGFEDLEKGLQDGSDREWTDSTPGSIAARAIGLDMIDDFLGE